MPPSPGDHTHSPVLNTTLIKFIELLMLGDRTPPPAAAGLGREAWWAVSDGRRTGHGLERLKQVKMAVLLNF
jgi:hypothetical protein